MYLSGVFCQVSFVKSVIRCLLSGVAYQVSLLMSVVMCNLSGVICPAFFVSFHTFSVI